MTLRSRLGIAIGWRALGYAARAHCWNLAWPANLKEAAYYLSWSRGCRDELRRLVRRAER